MRPRPSPAPRPGRRRTVRPYQLDELPTDTPAREGRRSTSPGPARPEPLADLGLLHRSKVDCVSRILWRLADREGLRLSVIRPSWLYGEPRPDHDGRGSSAASARARSPSSAGATTPWSAPSTPERSPPPRSWRPTTPAPRARRTTSPTRARSPSREFFNLFADACEAPRPHRHVPYGVTFAVATGIEAFYRLIRRRRPPFITRYATWLMGRDLAYSTAKAETKLGWRPAVGYRESIERTVRWYLGLRPNQPRRPWPRGRPRVALRGWNPWRCPGLSSTGSASRNPTSAATEDPWRRLPGSSSSARRRRDGSARHAAGRRSARPGSGRSG